MVTRADRMAHALALILAMPGRDEHPRDVSLYTQRDRRGGQNHLVRLKWEDSATGESGLLGIVDRFEVVPVVRQLYSQIREWRARCEYPPPEPEPVRAKAKGAGA